MSVVAVKVTKGGIEIAGDSQTNWGGNKHPKQQHNDSQIKSYGKIFEVNGMTLGCAGCVSDINILQIYCKTHKPMEMSRDSVLDWFVEFKEWASQKMKVGFNEISIHGIIVSEKRAFCFFDFMEVFEVKDFYAVGSGMWIAIGAMECGADAYNAVKAAAKYDLFCGGEITKVVKK